MSGDAKSKKKVCHVGRASSILVQRWVNYFAERGWEVDIITFEPAEKKFLHSDIRQHVVNPGKIPFIGFIRAYLGVKKHLKRIKPDIIHAHSIPAYGIYVGLYSKKGGKEPYIQAAWGFHHIEIDKGYKRKLDKLCLERAEVITTTSDDLKIALVKNLQADESKFRVFSWGIDLNIFRLNYKEELEKLRKELDIRSGAPVIISPRNMAPYYRIQNIVKAVPKVLKAHPESVFIFLRGYGSEEFERKMKEEAKNLDIEKNTRFISGLLTPEEMAIYLNLADISISISKTDQLSSVLLESMVCNAFPILSDIAIYKKYITSEKNGLFVSGNNPDEIANAVIQCLNNKAFMERAYDINSKFIKESENWHVNSKKMENIYMELLVTEQKKSTKPI
ncbi:MAG: glycosyltransferase family 4 protein [Thermoplasmata archaeon]|nr:MAG: glycosyltransferase family 4 protein [Thermoplasmata archaeon]